LRGEILAGVFEKWSERERSILINLLKRVRKDAEESASAMAVGRASG
jgi:hypothetical protein